MQQPQVFKYNYAFLYQSMAVYATTLAVYLVIRGMMHEEFSQVFYDPVVYLLCIIILASALAVVYNVMMRRRIEIDGSVLALQRAVRRVEIDTKDVRGVRLQQERTNGIISRAGLITIFTASRRRPIRVVPYNFERSEELTAAIKAWAADKAHIRARRGRPRTPRHRP
ncbi:MAG: hypothetical protein JSS75_12290 [Bacteroidetes bacterium]|nr:hypothetical protein [Bacteroidota bacterium]